MMLITEMRKVAGMTQAAFADYIGVSKSSIEKWEAKGCPEHLRALIEYKLKHEGLLNEKKAGQP